MLTISFPPEFHGGWWGCRGSISAAPGWVWAGPGSLLRLLPPLFPPALLTARHLCDFKVETTHHSWFTHEEAGWGLGWGGDSWFHTSEIRLPVTIRNPSLIY